MSAISPSSKGDDSNNNQSLGSILRATLIGEENNKQSQGNIELSSLSHTSADAGATGAAGTGTTGTSARNDGSDTDDDDDDDGNRNGSFRLKSKPSFNTNDEEFKFDALPETPKLIKQCMQYPVIQWLAYIFAESVWIYLALLGMICAFGSSVVDDISAELMRLHCVFAGLAPGAGAMYFFWVLYPMVLVGASVAITRQISPNAVGSGIPEMKSIMTGFSIPGFLTARTLVAKFIGMILALGSGLSIGTEGPFVHMSCIIATIILRIPIFRGLRISRSLRKHLLAAACAVGVASSLGAPVGGVLFSVEVTNTIYQTTHHAKGFFCAVCGAFAFVIFNDVTQLITSDTVGHRAFVSLFTTHFEPLPYVHAEVPLFVLLSLICGFLGGLFNFAYMKLVSFRRNHRKNYPNIFNPIPFALLVVLFTATASFPTGDVAHYDPLRRYYPGGNFFEFSLDRVVNELFLETDLKYLKAAESWMFPSLAVNLILFAIGKSILTILAISIAIPSGIFLPIFAIGAAYGRVFGELFRLMFGEGIVAGGYAVIGAAAFTASCTGTVSTAVIIFEITSQMNYLVPVLLAVTVGRAAGKVISKDIYTCMGVNRHLPSLPELNYQKSQGTLVKDIMQPNHVTVPRFVSKSQLEEILSHKSTSQLRVQSPQQAQATAASATSPDAGMITAAVSANESYVSSSSVVDSSQPPKSFFQRAMSNILESALEDDSDDFGAWSDPNYTFPLVDGAGLFLGSVTRGELEEVLKRMKKKSRKSRRQIQEASTDAYEQIPQQEGEEEEQEEEGKSKDKDDEEEIADITKTCHTDGLAMNMPSDTALGDAVVLFEVHKILTWMQNIEQLLLHHCTPQSHRKIGFALFDDALR